MTRASVPTLLVTLALGLGAIQANPAPIQPGPTLGQDVLAAATANYSSHYALEIEALFAALAQPTATEPETRAVEPIGISLDLLVQRADAVAGAPLERIDDGAVLRDGRGSAAGDRLEIRFTASCACYVYVIGIDATGYVVRLFPDPQAQFTNPVVTAREYRLPEAGSWWGLDEQRGVEQIHLVASYVERSDVERALTSLTRQVRTPARDYRSVVEVAQIPGARGIVTVKDTPIDALGTDMASAQTATGSQGDATAIGTVTTRWFHHE